MQLSDWFSWAQSGSVFVVALVLVVGCDLPTGGPSFKTETELSAPVVAEKTFSFLGGPRSPHEPLIDTTTATFESIFRVGTQPEPSLFVRETVRSFDVGALDRALEEATQGIGVETTVSEPVLRGTDLATQSVDLTERRSTGTLESPEFRVTGPIGPPNNSEDTLRVSFPTDEIPSPRSETFRLENATFGAARLTRETTHGGARVNHVVYILQNGDDASRRLTDGDGNAPRIRLETGDGTQIAAKRFDRPVAPGTSERVTLRVAGARLDRDTEAVLTVVGGDPRDDSLRTEATRFRYREVTFQNVDRPRFQPDVTTVAPFGKAEIRVAGGTVRDGTLRMEVRNDFSFPVTFETIRLTNAAGSLDPLPSDFPRLDVSESTGTLQPGEQTELDVDLAGRGISDAVDLALSGSAEIAGDQLTVSSNSGVELSAQGELSVDNLYFWPDGEQVRTGGAFDVETGRLQFEAPSDFVELEAGTLAFDNLVSEPEVAFDRLRVSLPGLRRPPYASEDSLVLRFVEDPRGRFEFSPIGVDDPPRDIAVDVGDLRLSPTGNRVDYHLHGVLETVGTPTADNVRLLRFEDAVSADVSVSDLDVRALEAGVTPFSVPVTPDANGDGRLDLSDDAEASVVSIEGFDTFAGSIDGLQLDGGRLTFTINTDAGSDAQLYAALQGRQGKTSTFLAGRGDRSVSADDPLGDDFYRGGRRIAAQNLIQFGVQGASADRVVSQSVTLTDANSSVDDFISALPSSLRFVAQARLTGDSENRIRLRRPLTFDAGLDVEVPVRFEDSFTVRDTVDADLSSLADVTAPDSGDVTVSTATLSVDYTNRLPMGANLRMTVLDGSGASVLVLPGESESLQIGPAPKGEDGTARDANSGTVTLDLSESEVRTLAQGTQIRLRLGIDQREDGPPATVRATDTIQLSLRARVKATVAVGE